METRNKYCMEDLVIQLSYVFIEVETLHVFVGR